MLQLSGRLYATSSVLIVRALREYRYIPAVDCSVQGERYDEYEVWFRELRTQLRTATLTRSGRLGLN